MNKKPQDSGNDLIVIAGFGTILISMYLFAQAYATDEQQLLYTDGLLIGIGASLSIVLGWEVLNTPRRELLKPPGLLSLTLLILWIVVCVFRSWVFYFRTIGSPAELRIVTIPFLLIVAFLGFTQFVIVRSNNRQVTVTPIFLFAAAIGVATTTLIGLSVMLAG